MILIQAHFGTSFKHFFDIVYLIKFKKHDQIF